MKPRNYGAIALLAAFTFFERFAYYGFRTTVFPRLLREEGMPTARIAVFMSLSVAGTVVGLMVGGGLSLATRSRFLLAGTAALVALVQGVAAVAPLAGLVLLPFACSVARPLVYLAAAEEIDQEARVWKAVAVGVVLYGATNAGSFFASILAAGAHELSPALGYAVPIVGAVVAVICSFVLAFAFPGSPFRWGTHEALVSGPEAAPYRPEPGVRRAAGGPSPWILALVAFVMLLSTCGERGAEGATFAVLEGSTRNAFRWLGMLNPVIVVFVGVLVASLAGYLASTRSRLSPTWPMGAALAVQALAMVSAAIAFTSFSRGAAMGSAVLDALAEGVAAPIALGYVLGTLSSRWVGLVGAGYGVFISVIGAVMSPLTARHDVTMPVVCLAALGLVVAAALTLVLGPRLHRGSDAAS